MFRFKEFLKEQNNKDDEYKVIKTTGLSGGQPPKKDDYQPMKTTGLSGGQPPKTQTPKNKIIINPLKEDFSKPLIKVEKHESTKYDPNITDSLSDENLKKSGFNERHGYEEIAPIISNEDGNVKHDMKHKNLDDANTVHQYTRSSFLLNDYLHKKDAGHEVHDLDIPNYGELMQKKAEKLSNVLKRQPAPQDMHVYSGIVNSPLVEAKHGIKDLEKSDEAIKARMPSFTSTSVKPEVASIFGSNVYDKDHDAAVNHMLKFKIPKGSTHGLYIGHHSKFPSENEFLLDKGKKVHIHPEPEIINTQKTKSVYNKDAGEWVDKPHQIHIWHAHIVE